MTRKWGTYHSRAVTSKSYCAMVAVCESRAPKQRSGEYFGARLTEPSYHTVP